jgi:hypothetical protein
VRPPRVIDDTNPADVDHTGNSTTPTDGRLVPDYTQLGFRVPAIVVSNRASRRVIHDGPFEHTSTLKMIESTFGLHSLTARDANAVDLRQVLHHKARHRVPRASSRPAARCQGPPPTPPRAAAPPASRQSLRPRYPKAKESPRRPSCRSPGIQPEPGWGNSRAATASGQPGKPRPRRDPARTSDGLPVSRPPTFDSRRDARLSPRRRRRPAPAQSGRAFAAHGRHRPLLEEGFDSLPRHHGSRGPMPTVSSCKRWEPEMKWEPTCSDSFGLSATCSECSRRSWAPRPTQSDSDRQRNRPGLP